MVSPSLRLSEVALVQSIYWLHKAHPLSKSGLELFTLPSETSLTTTITSTTKRHLGVIFQAGFWRLSWDVSFSATMCQGTSGELSQELLMTNAIGSAVQLLVSPSSGLNVPTAEWLCLLQIFWINKFVLYIRGFPLVSTFLDCHSWQLSLKQLPLEYAIQSNLLSAIFLLKLIIEVLHGPVRDWNMETSAVNISILLQISDHLLQWNHIAGSRFCSVKIV